MYLGKGVEYGDAKLIWCLIKPFLSLFVYVVSPVERALLIGELLRFCDRSVVIFIVKLVLTLSYFLINV